VEFFKGKIKVVPRIETRHHGQRIDGVIGVFPGIEQINEIFNPEPVHQVGVIHIIFHKQICAQLFTGDI
jgi:hypothetical protein